MTNLSRFLRWRWKRLSDRGKLAVVIALGGIGLLFWVPTVVKHWDGGRDSVSSNPQLTEEVPGRHVAAGPSWRDVEHLRATRRLLQSAHPEELTRDPFADDTAETQSAAAPVPVPEPQERP